MEYSLAVQPRDDTPEDIPATSITGVKAYVTRPVISWASLRRLRLGLCDRAHLSKPEGTYEQE